MKSNTPFLTIIAILGIALIGSAWYISRTHTPAPDTTLADQNNSGIQFRPITADDHILGDPKSKVTLLEYSDTECPYCIQFHKVIVQLMAEYGNNGNLAWVYRHSPILQRHPKAQREAEATECATELGGKEMFWKYLNTIMTNTPGNNELDPAVLPQYASQLGLDVTAFNTCLDSRKYKTKVETDSQDAVRAGLQGTPYSLLISNNGKDIVPLNGSVPYEQLKQYLDGVLKAK